MVENFADSIYGSESTIDTSAADERWHPQSNDSVFNDAYDVPQTYFHRSTGLPNIGCEIAQSVASGVAGLAGGFALSGVAVESLAATASRSTMTKVAVAAAIVGAVGLGTGAGLLTDVVCKSVTDDKR